MAQQTSWETCSGAICIKQAPAGRRQPETIEFRIARDQDRTPFAFAGVWRPWTGTRGTKANPVVGNHIVFSFLTTEPNDAVRPIHAKAMPVILTEDNWDQWLDGSQEEAPALQQPAPVDLIQIVASGEKRDPPESRMG